MAEIKIDTSQLTHTTYLIPGHTSELVDGIAAPRLQLEPGDYSLEQIGAAISFPFSVTTEGTVDDDATHDGYLSGRGTDTLVVRGVEVTLDGRALSHDLLLGLFGATVLSKTVVHTLRLLPCPSYGVQPGAMLADFVFGSARRVRWCWILGSGGWRRRAGRRWWCGVWR